MGFFDVAKEIGNEVMKEQNAKKERVYKAEERAKHLSDDELVHRFRSSYSRNDVQAFGYAKELQNRGIMKKKR